jgi:2TM domain
MTSSEAPHDARVATLRDRAVKRLKKRRDFYTHLLTYMLVNGFLVGIWR